MAHRILPPDEAAADIERLASKGYSTIGLAKFFDVSRSVIARWFKEDESLEECYEQGRDSYRQTLEEQIIQMTMANKNPAGLIYLLKAKFKMYDQPSSKPLVDLSVNPVQNVLVIKDLGTVEDWQAKALAQQRGLALDVAQIPSRQIEASTARVTDPATAAPYYGPPVPSWQAKAPSEPIYVPESIPSAPIAPVLTPVWRKRA